MVKAIAPNAPSGASFTMMPMMRKKICPAVSMALLTTAAFSPSPVTTQPVRIETRSTCSRSPVAKASKKLFGISAMMCATVESAAALLA